MSIEQNTKILASDVTTSLSGKAPTSHASANTTYGIGTGSNYGHVKLSDSTSSTSAASAGIAASPKAVKAAYDKAVEAANSGGSKSVGDLWFGIDPKSKPANVQLYAGQSLSRSSYAAHWAFVNGGNRTVISESEWQSQVSTNGFCPYYSSGNGSSTYRMPLVKGIHPKFVEALASAGAYTKAGLPNITGTVSAISASVGWNNESGLPDSGAFNMTYSTEGGAQWNGGNVAVKITLDASLSNQIYGNSDTVQPPAINIVMGEYVVGTVATIGEANATSLLASITHLESQNFVKSVNGVNADASGNVAVDSQYNTNMTHTLLFSSLDDVNKWKGNITFSQAYTNFKYLFFEFSDTYHLSGTTVEYSLLSVEMLKKVIATAKTTGANRICLFGGLYSSDTGYEFGINCTDTYWQIHGNLGCYPRRVWGVK